MIWIDLGSSWMIGPEPSSPAFGCLFIIYILLYLKIPSTNIYYIATLWHFISYHGSICSTWPRRRSWISLSRTWWTWGGKSWPYPATCPCRFHSEAERQIYLVIMSSVHYEANCKHFWKCRFLLVSRSPRFIQAASFQSKALFFDVFSAKWCRFVMFCHVLFSWSLMSR